MVEPGLEVHPLDAPRAVAELVQVHVGGHHRGGRRRAPAGQREPTREGRGDRVAREGRHVDALEPAIAQLVAQRVAQGDPADRRDGSAAREQLRPELQPSGGQPERDVADRLRRVGATERAQVHPPPCGRGVGGRAPAGELKSDRERRLALGAGQRPGDGGRAGHADSRSR